MEEEKYTIDEIVAYLRGCMLSDGSGKKSDEYNLALTGAIALIKNEWDGIRDFTKRRSFAKNLIVAGNQSEALRFAKTTGLGDYKIINDPAQMRGYEKIKVFFVGNYHRRTDLVEILVALEPYKSSNQCDCEIVYG